MFKILIIEDNREKLKNILNVITSKCEIPEEFIDHDIDATSARKLLKTTHYDLLIVDIAIPNKKITPHKLRSTYGTALYRQTGDIRLVADVLGHENINTTIDYYAAIEDEHKQKAANAVKIRTNNSNRDTES